MNRSHFSYLENHASELIEILSQELAWDGHVSGFELAPIFVKGKMLVSQVWKIQPSSSQKVFVRHDWMLTQVWDMWRKTYLQILETTSPKTKKYSLCPLISPFVILTIIGPQHTCAHRVSDQNIQKQRKVHLFSYFSYCRPPKLSPNRGPQYLAVYQIPSKNVANLKVIKKNRGHGHSSRFSEKCNHTLDADIPALLNKSFRASVPRP